MFVGSSWVDCVFKEKDKSPIKLYNKFGPQDLKKDVSSSCHKHGTKKKFWVPMRNRTSDLRIPRSDALPLSHRDSTVSEVYYEVHMTRVLHTARISNVDSVMFLTGRVSLELRNRPRSPKSLCGSVVEHRSANPKVWGSIPHGDSEFFLCPTLVTRRKNIFLNSSPSSKLTISTFLSRIILW